MELFYLLCSILSTFLTSLALSLLLPFHKLLLRFSPRAASSCSVSLYQGTVWHERRRPVHHSFRYAVRYALFDLDLVPEALPNHLSADEARRIAGTNGQILLLTIPQSVGYEQNPLSLYYCYDNDEQLILKKCIAEVTNTPWGERVTFVFNPDSDLVAKPLHVSPFMDMLGDWSIRANAPENDLFVSISVQHPEFGSYFTATLKAKRLSSSSVSDHALFFWLMPHKVAVWIYWHAFKLWWKNASFVQHPRYTNPAYREDALVRDQNLQCCSHAVKLDEPKQLLQLEGSGKGCVANRKNEARFCTWKDAKWPWS